MLRPTENDSRQLYVFLAKTNTQNARSAVYRTEHDKCYGVIVHMVCEVVTKTRGLQYAEPNMTNVTV